MMSNLKKTVITGFLYSASLFCASLFFEHIIGLTPCPLCIIQRFAILLIAFLYLFSYFVDAKPFLRTSSFIAIFSIALIGAITAARQVYLQHLPADQVPACGPGLKYMFDTLPFQDVIHLLFQGSGECAKVEWRFLGLSLAEYSFVNFVALLGLNIWQFRQNK